ncbi:MAG TPA: hypothetical protein PKO06_22075, partial [Candidatus Ozemobacteraceae bacterium]|nr:hypothetical protein [Candidatus Ozemobacteraceae bacterium]
MQWSPEQVREIADQALQLVEARRRFSEAAQSSETARWNSPQYVWVCLKNAVRDQVWENAPEDLRELHEAMATVLRRSNGFKRHEHLIGLGIWPNGMPPNTLDLNEILHRLRTSFKAEYGFGRLGLKRGYLVRLVRQILTTVGGPISRPLLYLSVREFVQLPRVTVGLPPQIEVGGSAHRG